MVNGLLLILGVIASIFVVANLMKKANIIEVIGVGAVIYFCITALCSGFLFVVDSYSVLLSLIFPLIISCLLSGILFFKNGKKIEVNTDIREFVIPLVVILAFMPFVSAKNECFGMGQDQGGYQVQALAFISGDTKAIKDFDEYYSLNDEYQEVYIQKLSEEAGLDELRDEYFDSNYSESNSPSIRYFHGIPVFASFMALWGSAFGISSMQNVQTVFYSLIILLIYLCSRRLGVSKSGQIMCSVAAGFSPIIIWASKSALTEPFTAVLVLFFVYLILSEDKRFNILSIVPVFAFAIYHVSFFTMVPMFIAAYGIMYLFNRRQYEFYYLLAMPFILLMSFALMVKIQPVYAFNNYWVLMAIVKHLKFVHFTNKVDIIPPVVIVLALLLLAIVIAIILVIKKTKLAQVKPEDVSNSKVVSIIVRVFVALCALKVAVDVFRTSDRSINILKALFLNARSFSLYQFMLASGILLSVVAVVILFIKPQKMFKSQASILMTVLFLYAVLFYSAMLYKQIDIFFYFGRYLVPYLSIAILFVMMIVDDMKLAIKVPLFVLSMCLFIPCNINMINHVDDTNMNWNNLKDITEIVSSNDSIVVEDDSKLLMWMPLNYMTDSLVYPRLDSDRFEEASYLASINGGDVYYISEYPIYSEDDRFELVYSDMVNRVPVSSGDDNVITAYPNSFGEYGDMIYMYRYSNQDIRSYPISGYYYSYSGLGGYEGSFAWTSSEHVDLNCCLADRNYEMNVVFNNLIPFDSLEINELIIDVYVNDTYLDSVVVSNSSNADGFSMVIDEELIEEGDNTISFESELWDVSQVNPVDDRELGFAISEVDFISVD